MFSIFGILNYVFPVFLDIVYYFKYSLFFV